MEPTQEIQPSEDNISSAPNSIVLASKPHKSTGLIIATIIFAILAIAGIVTAIYFFIDSNNKATDLAKLKAELDLIKQETGAEIIDKEENGTTVTIVKTTDSEDEEVKKIVKQAYESLEKNIPDGIFYTTFNNGSIIKISDDDVYSYSDRAYGITSASHYSFNNATGKAIMESAGTFVSAILVNNGYVKDEEFMGDVLFYNSNTDIYCVTSMSSLPYLLSCSKATWISSEDKELSLALAKAADTRFISVSRSTIQDSPVSPYQKLVADGYGAALLFYRTSPDSAWQFFNGAQGLLGCDEYTGDASKAFAGETCYNLSTDQTSTVQP